MPDRDYKIEGERMFTAPCLRPELRNLILEGIRLKKITYKFLHWAIGANFMSYLCSTALPRYVMCCIILMYCDVL